MEAKLILSLLSSTEIGDLKLVISIFEQKNNINLPIDDAFIIACKNGHLDIVDYLLKRGANIHYSYDWPLRISSTHGKLNIVKRLIENGADIHAGRVQAIHNACNGGHLDVVKYLVENGAEIYSEEPGGALYFASTKGHIDIVDYLLLKGASPNKVDVNFVIKYYLLNTIENILRLYNLYSKGVDITKLVLITREDINTLQNKASLINKTLVDNTLKGPTSIIMSYLV